MNVAEKVRKRHNETIKGTLLSEYDKGYYEALKDVQNELNKEVGIDYDNEIAKYREQNEELKMKLKDVEQRIELEHNAIDIEKEQLKAKVEMIELIFGEK